MTHPTLLAALAAHDQLTASLRDWARHNPDEVALVMELVGRRVRASEGATVEKVIALLAAAGLLEVLRAAKEEETP